MDEVNRFYRAEQQSSGTHLQLRWRGRVRYTVPREAAAQQACWTLFQPGRLEFPLRAMARLPRLLAAVNCVETENLESIREAIGNETGLSCCRAGAEGVWTKDTILFLDKKTVEPVCLVKTGSIGAVDALLQNEANWLRELRNQQSLVDHIPELIAQGAGQDFCFVAQSALSGEFDLRLGEPQFSFLRKLQNFSAQSARYEDSRLYRTLHSRIRDLSGLLPKRWSNRLKMGMQRIEQSLCGTPIVMVAAHNDFTQWNIRVKRGVARVFDWEYADYEQLPLFDPLHFALVPMALKSRPTVKIVQRMHETLQLCQIWFGKEVCRQPQTQSLAYLMNVSTLYLWSIRGRYDSNPIVDSYSHVMDYLCNE